MCPVSNTSSPCSNQIYRVPCIRVELPSHLPLCIANEGWQVVCTLRGYRLNDFTTNCIKCTVHNVIEHNISCIDLYNFFYVMMHCTFDKCKCLYMEFWQFLNSIRYTSLLVIALMSVIWNVAGWKRKDVMN